MSYTYINKFISRKQNGQDNGYFGSIRQLRSAQHLGLLFIRSVVDGGERLAGDQYQEAGKDRLSRREILRGKIRGQTFGSAPGYFKGSDNRPLGSGKSYTRSTPVTRAATSARSASLGRPVMSPRRPRVEKSFMRPWAGKAPIRYHSATTSKPK